MTRGQLSWSHCSAGMCAPPNRPSQSAWGSTGFSHGHGLTDPRSQLRSRTQESCLFLTGAKGGIPGTQSSPLSRLLGSLKPWLEQNFSPSPVLG